MANIRKSFNFRNGIQVDNDNFVVSPAGRVGIGTSAPNTKLDVAGNVQVAGLTVKNDLQVDQNVNIIGVTTVGFLTASDVFVSGIVTATKFIGDGSGLTDIVATSPGIIIKNDDSQVGTAATINFGSNISVSPISSGIVTVTVTNLDGNVNAASGVSTFTELKVGTAITMSAGIITATTFSGNSFSGSLSGDVTGNVNATSGVSTFTELKVGTAITMSAGIITATTFSGSLPTSSLTGTISSTQIANSAVTDAKIDTVSASKLTGALPAISGAAVTSVTAVGLTGSPNVNLGITTSSSIISGSIVGTGLSVTSIGIGTAIPANTFQQRATGATELQVTSDTASASITVGREPGTSNTNNAEFRYGGAGGFAFSNAQSLDIVNYGTGNFNYYLSANNAGAAAGDYVWHKGANNSQLMALTKDGNLGIGITNPTHKLNVQGISTFTDAAYFESTLETGGDLTVGGNLLFGSSSNITATLRGNVESGNGGNVVLTVPAGNDNPVENAQIKARVVGGASTITKLDVSGIGYNDQPIFSVRVGTTADPVASDVVVNVNSEAQNKFVITDSGGVGIGTTNPTNSLDLKFAQRPAVFPNMSTAVRNNLSSIGVATSPGSVIYNTTDNKLQVYNGSSWIDLH